MGVKTKKGKGRLDKFYHLAKEQGYRSRAAFKLIQLNRKFNFLSNAKALLDLCAAPGGWLQVAAKNMPMGSLILGVDLVPIKPIRGVKTLIGDITTQATRAALRKEAKGSMFEVVVHDGAPNVGGAWSSTLYSQAALVLDSLKLATEFLTPRGTFVTKIFRSKDYNALLYAFNQLFDKVEATKPTASRNTSAEIFVVCQGYKAPAKVDPRLLDPKHLFQEVADAPKVMGPDALLRQKTKQRRHREGYEDNASTTYKLVSALEFVASAAPVELLGKVTQFALDGDVSWQPVEGLESADIKELAEKIRKHPSTNEEIRSLCTDLQVLGRSEFKSLLKWRLALRKALKDDLGGIGEVPKGRKKGKDADTKTQEGKEGAEEGADEGAQDPEAKLLSEMEALREAATHRDKKERKKMREMKKKARIRAAQMTASQGVAPDDNGQDDMFSLSALPGSASLLNKVAEASALNDRELEMLEAADSSDDDYAPDGPVPGASDGEGGDGDTSDDELRYELMMDEALERSYKHYLERKGQRDDVVKEKRRRLGKDLELDEDDNDQQPEETSDNDDQNSSDADTDQDEDGSDDDLAGSGRGGRAAGKEAGVGGGLVVRLDESRAGVPTTAPAMAAQWFSQDLFNDPNLQDDESEGSEGEEEMSEEEEQGAARAKSHAEAGPRTKRPAAAARGDSGDSEDEGEATPRVSKKARSEGFEVVPLAKDKKGSSSKKGRGSDSDGSDSDTDSEDEFDMLDDQGKAEVLALAKRMLRRKEKESIIDAAYNRYAFHDTGLPRWFTDDERKHMRPIMPVTKEEVEAEKARLRAIDARPIKKVAEAKGRQKRRIQAKLDQAREKAESIAAQEDVPMKSKMREIEKLYARARAAGKKGKGKGGKGGKGKDGKGRKGPPVDKRLKKDKRAQKAADKRKGKGKGRKGR